MRAGRRTAAVLLTLGVVAVGAGVTGLLVTRHPQTVPVAAVHAFPAPTGSIVAVPLRGTATVARPVSLEIPSIGVKTRLIHLGLNSDGSLQVPPLTEIAVAGWYTGSPRPGATGSAVIAGHIDSYKGQGVFYRLRYLKRGARVYVRRADGSLAAFQVTVVRKYAKDKFPTDAVYGPVPDPELRLITCGGTFDPSTRSYLSNVVVYATEVG